MALEYHHTKMLQHDNMKENALGRLGQSSLSAERAQEKHEREGIGAPSANKNEYQDDLRYRSTVCNRKENRYRGVKKPSAVMTH